MAGVQGAATFLMKTKVVHGRGTLALLPEELRGLGARKPWIVTDPGLVSAGICTEIESILEKAGFAPGRFDQVAHVARASSVDASVAAARDFGFDSVIAVGGGSALVIGKTTAIVGANGGNIRDYDGVGRVPLPPFPIVAIPTTAGSGADVSMFSPVVDEERNLKLLIGGPNCFPHVAILDPLLLRTLPFTQAVYSGVDALAHAIEAQLSTGATPITDALGLSAMQALMGARGLRWPEFQGTDVADIIAYIRTQATNPRRHFYLEPADPATGRIIFQQKGCTNCHGVRGSAGVGAPQLGDRSLPRTLGQFAGLMWNHSPAMWTSMRTQEIPRPQFSNKEMADLIAYLFAQRYFDPSGSAHQGRRIFEVKGCATCHLPDGEGIGPALSPWRAKVTPMALATAMWNHGPMMLTRMREQQIPWPRFQSQEMVDLMEFLNQGVTSAQLPGKR